jgi:hypothetical protein
VRDLEPLEILGRRLQKRVLALPLVVSTQIAQPEPQLKTQCETASLKISKAALARKMSCAVNSWKIAKAVCLWKTHAGRRQNQIALLALEQRMSCMAATATRRAARFGAQEAMRTGFETDEASRIAQMNAYQNMAPLISDLQNQSAAGLISVGEAQRQLDQRALDLAYADYLLIKRNIHTSSSTLLWALCLVRHTIKLIAAITCPPQWLLIHQYMHKPLLVLVGLEAHTAHTKTQINRGK